MADKRKSKWTDGLPFWMNPKFYSGNGNNKNKNKNKVVQTQADLDDIRKENELDAYRINSGQLTQEQVDALNKDREGLSNKVVGGFGPFNRGSIISKDNQKLLDSNAVEDLSSTSSSSSTTLPKERLKRTYRNRGGLLRYPFEALTEKTDYLQIDIVEYEPASKNSDNKNNFIGRPGSRRIPLESKVPKGLSTQNLVNKGTILLQIPSQVQDGNSVNYGESEMNTVVGAGIQAAIKGGEAFGQNIAEGKFFESFGAVKDEIERAYDGADLNRNTIQALFNSQIASSMVGAFGANVSVNQILQRQSGQSFNPNMELLFNGPTLRSFRFSFKMTPRSQEEAEQCKLIIRSFKMNLAPKVTSGRGKQSLFLNTPNVFQLRYKSGYRNHPFLHKFKQCFLQDISVNYTGEGVYATYENREPVSMIMDLTFKELEPIYDQDYFNDRGRDLDSTVGF